MCSIPSDGSRSFLTINEVVAGRDVNESTPLQEEIQTNQLNRIAYIFFGVLGLITSLSAGVTLAVPTFTATILATGGVPLLVIAVALTVSLASWSVFALYQAYLNDRHPPHEATTTSTPIDTPSTPTLSENHQSLINKINRNDLPFLQQNLSEEEINVLRPHITNLNLDHIDDKFPG